MSFTAGEIAKKVNGEVIGNKAITITGFSNADLASCGDLTFAENEYFFSLADKSQASAILASSGFHSNNKTVIQVKDARIAFARVLPLFFNEKPFTPGIHPSAIIAEICPCLFVSKPFGIKILRRNEATLTILYLLFYSLTKLCL